MVRLFSLLLAWGSVGALVLVALGALYFLFDIRSFAKSAEANLGMGIQWSTVTAGQWYGAWVVTVLYLGVGLWGLFYLHRAFRNFAQGEFFSLSNSRDLRWFSILLFVQAAAKPVHTALCSVVLSLNHGPGQKVLAISFGSHELQIIALAMILWVISDLLVKGRELEHENRLFV